MSPFGGNRHSGIEDIFSICHVKLKGYVILWVVAPHGKSPPGQV